MIDKYNIDLAKYRLDKAKDNLLVAKEAFKLTHYDNSVSRSYYAIFTAMRALLAIKGLDSKTHKGVITLFSQHFIKEKIFSRRFHQIITEAKLIREKADYGDFIKVSRDIASAHLNNAEEFINKAEQVFIKTMRKKLDKK